MRQNLPYLSMRSTSTSTCLCNNLDRVKCSAFSARETEVKAASEGKEGKVAALWDEADVFILEFSRSFFASLLTLLAFAPIGPLMKIVKTHE